MSLYQFMHHEMTADDCAQLFNDTVSTEEVFIWVMMQ
jgi:hypothetical protein